MTGVARVKTVRTAKPNRRSRFIVTPPFVKNCYREREVGKDCAVTTAVPVECSIQNSRWFRGVTGLATMGMDGTPVDAWLR
jgi:hypothetical protein